MANSIINSRKIILKDRSQIIKTKDNKKVLANNIKNSHKLNFKFNNMKLIKSYYDCLSYLNFAKLTEFI